MIIFMQAYDKIISYSTYVHGYLFNVTHNYLL